MHGSRFTGAAASMQGSTGCRAGGTATGGLTCNARGNAYALSTAAVAPAVAPFASLTPDGCSAIHQAQVPAVQQGGTVVGQLVANRTSIDVAVPEPGSPARLAGACLGPTSVRRRA